MHQVQQMNKSSFFQIANTHNITYVSAHMHYVSSHTLAGESKDSYQHHRQHGNDNNLHFTFEDCRFPTHVTLQCHMHLCCTMDVKASAAGVYLSASVQVTPIPLMSQPFHNNQNESTHTNIWTFSGEIQKLSGFLFDRKWEGSSQVRDCWGFLFFNGDVRICGLWYCADVPGVDAVHHRYFSTMLWWYLYD